MLKNIMLFTFIVLGLMAPKDEPWQRGPRRMRRVAVVVLLIVPMAVTVAVMSK